MTGAHGLLVVANLGAEEDFERRDPFPANIPRAAHGLVDAWREWLLSSASPILDVKQHAGPALLVPWLVTPAIEFDAGRRGLPVWGARSDVVRRVHDKAFAVALAARLHLVAAELARACTAFDADLCAPDVSGSPPVIAAIHDVITAWPMSWQQDFTCKPRLGTSGRGRVRGGSRPLDIAALARCAHRGGIVVEPWLTRVLDVSTQWLIAGDGTPQFLGSTRQLTNASGRWAGASFVLDADGIARAATAYDDEVRESAAIVVREAAAAGLRGVCGVDAFVYLDSEGRQRLRAVVECNARFTGGAVGIGVARARGLRGDITFALRSDGSFSIGTT